MAESGCWAPEAIVIVEFDTAEQAAAWYESPEYAQGGWTGT